MTREELKARIIEVIIVDAGTGCTCPVVLQGIQPVGHGCHEACAYYAINDCEKPSELHTFCDAFEAAIGRNYNADSTLCLIACSSKKMKEHWDIVLDILLPIMNKEEPDEEYP